MTTPADTATSQPVIEASAPGGRAPDILRRLLAVVAPIPMVAMGTFYLISPFPGLLLLGLALWHSHAAPAWAGMSLALGGFTPPFMPGPVAAGIGLWVAALGFAGAGVALWRRDRSR